MRLHPGHNLSFLSGGTTYRDISVLCAKARAFRCTAHVPTPVHQASLTISAIYMFSIAGSPRF